MTTNTNFHVGQLVYRDGDRWYPVREGQVLAPYVFAGIVESLTPIEGHYGADQGILVRSRMSPRPMMSVADPPQTVYDTPDLLARDLTTLADRVAESTTRPAADVLVATLMDLATRAALLPVAVVQQPDDPIWDVRNSIEPAAEPVVDPSFGMPSPQVVAPVAPATANSGLIE